MSCTSSDFFSIAEQLLQPSGEPLPEISLRTSACRAYYAVLHAADGSLPPDLHVADAAKKGKSSHQAVIDAMSGWGRAQRPGRVEAGIVARNLARLRAFRKKADYDLDADFTSDDAADVLRIAKASLKSAEIAKNQAVPKQA
jgi:uncharacterized protein (UPF0332 family)